MFDLNPQFPNNSRHRFNGDVQFRLETMEEDSGVCSPPLWERTIINSPSDSPVRFTNPRTLSPASRARAIAKGRHEMMEMVENMPETCYELSLKDIVEKRREFNDVEETRSMEEGEERSILTESQKKNKKQYESNKKTAAAAAGRSIVKNSSMNHNNNKGLLINMFFPFSIGSKKRKNSTSTTTNSSSGLKFSPKPELLDRRDWLWKQFTGSGDSESLGITSSSSSSSSSGDSTGRSGSSGSSGSSVAGSLRSNSHRTKNNCSYGCWSFFPSRNKIV